ncbi:hypothetical protein THAR02_07770 [Trichoderma harzianum]|uniref:glucan endo-1,6-beta-glucosidase n=1 Tax=Trichoderma harzianum TaxID=5544 RepID=A0A0F9XHX6_TRIHA|nr:hypothetical protein THAR02_07770 [Trichoderma harzianum]
MYSSLVGSLLLAGCAFAWHPHERELDAFNLTKRYEKLGKRWDPWTKNLAAFNGITKIRGVNFGGWLIAEPWMVPDTWTRVLGCVQNVDLSEFDCMRNRYSGDQRAEGNDKFETHWSQYITTDDVQQVFDVGLNTIRIPIGYWSLPDIVDSASEPFADGSRMMPYLDNVVEKAAELGIYVIIDFHGAPGGQQEDPFTGQNPHPAGFFNTYDFGRSYKWLQWMTNRIHTNSAYRTVGMLEVLNEPVSTHDANGRYPAPGEDANPGLTQTYYPQALDAIRQTENNLGISDGDRLHVQFMSSKWGSGDPRSDSTVSSDQWTAFDDHNYIGFGVSNAGDETTLMTSACNDVRAVPGQNFPITGEWSMTSGVDWNSDRTFFTNFFTAQQQLYEVPEIAGWVYWTWKTELNDPRWDYQVATQQGLIPKDAITLQNNVFQDVCSPYRS